MNKKIIKERIRKLLLEKKGDTHDYGCVMLDLKITKGQWDKFQSLILDDDIYEVEGDRSYGREDEPHITLLYGLHKTISDDEIKEISINFEIIEVLLKKISIFESEEYDVVKFDIIDDSKKVLTEINSEYAKLPHTTSFLNYLPHATLAYVKKGTGKNYIKTLSDDDVIKVNCDTIRYSKIDGSEIKYKLSKNK